MNKMSKLEKRIATIVLIGVAVILTGVLLQSFIYKPNTEQISSCEAEIKSLAEKVEEAKKAPALIVSYRSRNRQRRAVLFAGDEAEGGFQLPAVVGFPEQM